MLFGPPKIIGLVLNLSLRNVNGRRFADTVKKELVDFSTTLEDEDQLYLSTKDTPQYRKEDIVELNGKRVATIGNWQPQEIAPKLNIELQKALHAVTKHGDIDGEWYLCFITDRYRQNDNSHLSHVLEKNNQIWGEAKMLVITLGEHYDFKEFKEVCGRHNCRYHHMIEPTGIKNILTEWMGESK